MTRHLVWDWNGTLLDDTRLVVEAANAAFAELGRAALPYDEYRRSFRRPIPEFYADVLDRPAEEIDFPVLDKVFHLRYEAGLPDCELTPGSVEALTAWQGRQGRQSLLSMWFHDELSACVTGFGLEELFVRVDGLRAEVGGASKAEHLAEHLAALGLSGADAVLIGDTVDDHVSAEAAGAACVLFTGGVTDDDRLRATGRPVARTLAEAVALAADL